MPKITKSTLEENLRRELCLKDPIFRLKNIGGRLSGSVISETFRRKRDDQRQKMIWDALDQWLGPASVASVGMLLAYTPEEWNTDAEAVGGKLIKAHNMA